MTAEDVRICGIADGSRSDSAQAQHRQKANEAERRAIEAVRQLGNEIVQGWAQRQQQKKENEYYQKPEVSPKEKKPSTGSQSSEKSR